MSELNPNHAAILGALGRRPRILIQGQSAFCSESGVDALAEALREGSIAPPSAPRWWLNRTDDPGHRADAFAKREALALAPSSATAVAKVEWHAVLTSAIDGLTRKILEESGGRPVHQLTFARRAPASTDTPLYRLYGTIERSTSDELPPPDHEALRRRRHVAAGMMQLLPDLTSPNGHVFVSGWDPAHDWLRPRDLAAGLATLGVGQVYILGIAPHQSNVLREDEDLASLIDQRVVTVVEESLDELLAAFQSSGSLPADFGVATRGSQEFSVARHAPSSPHATPRESLSLSIPRREWVRLTAAMHIPVPFDVSEPLPPVIAHQQGLFRTLLAVGPSPENFRWLKELAFERSLLPALEAECHGIAAQNLPQDHVVTVYGQAGSGKSVLLSQLMLRLRRAGFPVAFARRSIASLDQTLVADFCGILSQHHASHLPLFLIYDANQEESDYADIASYLAGRNRKCVIIGSALPAQSQGATSRSRSGRLETHRLSLSSSLDPNEQSAFIAHFARLTGLTPDSIHGLLGADVSHFFAAIYRLAPDARDPLRAGLLAEFLDSAEKLQARIDKAPQPKTSGAETAMALALQRALGRALDEALSRVRASVPPSRDSAGGTRARTLVDTVMVCSRLGLQLPQSLALRLISHSVPVYRSTMEGDILVEHEVSPGVFTLAARHPIEAQIWVSSKLPHHSAQFPLIAALVNQLKPSEALEECSELEFIVQLLQGIGPEGLERFRMREHYGDIAEVLSQLSGSHDIHPRLLLQEAHCLRESVKAQQRHRPPDWRSALASWQSSLEQADGALRKAIAVVCADNRTFRTRSANRLLSTLNTERAAALGFQLGNIVRLVPEALRNSPEWAKQVDAILGEARAAWREALRIEPEGFHAISTACWIISDRLRATSLPPEQEAVLLAEWSSLIDRYLEIDLPPHQLDARDKAEHDFAQRVGDLSRLQSIIEREDRRGSSAVRVLEARAMERSGDRGIARSHLETHCAQQLYSERAVLLLYFRLWWLTETGQDTYFPKERLALSFSPAQWSTLLELCNSRLRLDSESDHPTVTFLKAAALVHLERVAEAQVVFEQLARSDVGGFRRSRSLILWSDRVGNPRVSSGEYQGRRAGSAFLAWCDDLRTNVRFFPADHGIRELRSGSQLPPFHVALNFRGLLAEPPARAHERS